MQATDPSCPPVGNAANDAPTGSTQPPVAQAQTSRAAAAMASLDWSVERILNAFPVVAREAEHLLPFAIADHDRAAEAQIRLVLATAQTYLELHQEADEHFRIARTLFEQLGDRRGVLFVSGRHSTVLQLCGHSIEAEQQLLTGLAEARARNDADIMIEHLTNLSFVLSSNQRYHEAITYLRESRTIAAGIGSQLGQVIAALNLASIYIGLHDHDSAALLCNEALAMIGDDEPFATMRSYFLINLAMIEDRRGNVNAAIARFADAADAAAARHDLRQESAARLHEARLRRTTGDADGALAIYRSIAARWQSAQPGTPDGTTQPTPDAAELVDGGPVAMPPPHELAALAQWGVEAITGNWTWATARNLEAVLAAGRPAEKDTRIQWSDALAEAYRGLGDEVAAFRQLQSSILLREEVWNETLRLQAYATAHAEQARAAREQANLERWRREEADRTLAQMEAMHTQNTTLIAQLQQQTALLEQLSRTDDLTGLSNRRHFDERFRAELARAGRFRRPLTVALADIDDFKRVNDAWSHAVGDRVLQHLAQILGTTTRDTDLVARYGGEEFAILLAETNLEEAAVLAERIRATVADYPWESIVPNIRVTISIGLWSTNGAVSPEDALARADERMYRAKRAGKNRIVAL